MEKIKFTEITRPEYVTFLKKRDFLYVGTLVYKDMDVPWDRLGEAVSENIDIMIHRGKQAERFYFAIENRNEISLITKTEIFLSPVSYGDGFYSAFCKNGVVLLHIHQDEYGGQDRLACRVWLVPSAEFDHEREELLALLVDEDWEE